MDTTNEQTRSIRLDQVDDVLVAFWEWLRVQEVRWRDDPERKEFHISPSIAAGEPLLDVHSGRAAGIRRRSFVRRLLRTVVLGFIVVAIAGTAVGWQYGEDKTRDTVRDWVSSLGSLSSVLVSSPAGPEVAADRAVTTPDPTAELAAVQDAAGLQATPARQSAAVAAGLSPELVHRLETMGSDIALVQRTVERLAARQEQMAQDVAALQSAQKSVAQKLSSLSQPPPIPVPAPRNTPRTAHSPAAPASAGPIPAPLPLH